MKLINFQVFIHSNYLTSSLTFSRFKKNVKRANRIKGIVLNNRPNTTSTLAC